MGDEILSLSAGLPFRRPSFGASFGKRERRPLITVGRLSSVYTLQDKKCYYVQDHRNSRQYLVDTGAEYSILPASHEDKRRQEPVEALEAANGSSVPVYGRRTVALNFGQGRLFHHTFLLAEVTKPLLGVDFFNANNIGIDTKGRRMYDLSSGSWFGGAADESNGGLICKIGCLGDSYNC